MKMLIVGGTGSFGSFYGKLFQKKGIEVFITSRNPVIGAAEAKKEGFGWDEKPDYSKYDIVVLSVPNLVAPKLVTQIVPQMQKNSLLMDFCSVKKEVCSSMEKQKKSKVALLSIHPMHGPRVNSVSGYPVAWIEIKENKKNKNKKITNENKDTNEKVEKIKRIFEEEKAKIVETSAEEHDKVLSLVQGLTHYAQFVSATTIYDLGISIADSQKFATPNYSLFLSLLSRVITQNPELYAEIQVSNPENKKMRKIFSKNAKKLENICSKDNSELLTKEIIKDAQSFKNAETLLLESDRAVNSLKYAANALKENVGKECLVENLITHNYHYGIIQEFNGEELLLKEGKQLSKISLQKLRLTTKKELIEWKTKNLGENYLDYSFFVSKNTSKDIIEKVFSWISEARIVVSDEFVSEKFANQQKSITIKVTFFSNEDKSVIDAKVNKTIEGLGFLRR